MYRFHIERNRNGDATLTKQKHTSTDRNDVHMWENVDDRFFQGYDDVFALTRNLTTQQVDDFWAGWPIYIEANTPAGSALSEYFELVGM